MPFLPDKKSHTYTATIKVKGPKIKGKDVAAFKRFRKAVKKLARTVRGKVREQKPKK